MLWRRCSSFIVSTAQCKMHRNDRAPTETEAQSLAFRLQQTACRRHITTDDTDVQVTDALTLLWFLCVCDYVRAQN